MRKFEKKDARDPQVRGEAWLGDTVLDLYARSYILRKYGEMDGEMLARMTSNQFLTSLGNPTVVEAEIGKVYQQDGLEAGFAWIEENLLPLFEKQERNRLVARR
jgi:dsRNA-specific ribonuclease